jgi:hypothetical protein
MFKTYRQVDLDRLHFGAGLVHLNSNKEWFLGILSVSGFDQG